MEKHREKEGAVHHQESKGEKKNIGMAIVAYILFFVPLLTDDKNDPFVRYHVRQGLAFLIAAIIVGICSHYWLDSVLSPSINSSGHLDYGRGSRRQGRRKTASHYRKVWRRT